MQEFIDFLANCKETGTTENSQEIILDLEEETIAFLVDFAEQQGVSLDTLIGAILSFQILKSKVLDSESQCLIEGV